MAIKIYEMLHSPYCIPVTQALRSFGVEYESIVIPNWDRREVARITGGRYYQVPVIVDGGQVVFETAEDPLAAPRYLDQAHFGGALFPAEWTGVHELLVSHIEDELESYGFKLCDIHLTETIEDLGERTMLVRHKERAFGRGCLEQWRADAEHLREALTKRLARFDARLQHAPFLLGDHPLYADFTLFGVVGNYTYQGYNELPPELKALADWRDRLADYRVPAPVSA